MSSRFLRRPIESLLEKERLRGENEEKYARISEEQRNEREETAEENTIHDSSPRDMEALREDWRPPRTVSDFQRMVDREYPDLGFTARYKIARRLHARHPFIEKAFLDGLTKGRDLRERARYGQGWDWESLHPLTPEERGYVLAKVRQVIMRQV